MSDYNEGGLLRPDPSVAEVDPDECIIRINDGDWRCVRREHKGRDCRTEPYDFRNWRRA